MRRKVIEHVVDELIDEYVRIFYPKEWKDALEYKENKGENGLPYKFLYNHDIDKMKLNTKKEELSDLVEQFFQEQVANL